MTEEIEKQEQNTTYPIHYHGYIHMFDPNAAKKIESNKTLLNQLEKQYGEMVDELGIG
jgi:hypothetical protein